MDLQIKGRVAMVAAASEGIGRGTVEALAREGCRVSLCGRSLEKLATAKREVETAIPGAVIFTVAADVSDAAALERWHTETVSALGPVEILVSNTGGPPAARFMKLSEEQWRSGIDSTLMNVVRMSRLVIPGMQLKKWGRIVHITSLAAKQPMDLLTVSSTLRAGLSALTKTMANQLAPEGILVNAVLPGHVLTGRQVHLNELRSKEEGISIEAYAERVQQAIPLGRYAAPREIGEVIAFLCSERASYITGASLQVDGGIIQGTF